MMVTNAHDAVTLHVATKPTQAVHPPPRCAPAMLALCLCGIMGSVRMSAAQDVLTDHDILMAADRARGAHEPGIEWTAVVTAEEAGRTNSVILQVKARGMDVLAITLEPLNQAGQSVLIRGGNMWFHKPDLSRPVPVSQRQRLLGHAAYADIATTDYAGQYQAQRLDDAVYDGVNCYVFDLRAASRQASYSRIRYWIDKHRLVGVAAAYYSASGKLLKRARLWHDHKTERSCGTHRYFCSRKVMQDVVTDSDRTIIELSAPRRQPIPAATFNVNLLGDRNR